MASSTSRTTQGNTKTLTQTTPQTQSTDQFGPTSTVIEMLSTGISNLFDCNMKALQDMLDRTSTATAKLFGAKTPADLMQIASSQAQSNFEAMTTYWRDLTSITLNEQSALGDAAQAQFDSSNKAAASATGGIGNIVPNGLDNLFGMTNAAFGNASKLYGQWADASGKAFQAIQFDLPGTGTNGGNKQATQHKRTNAQSHASN